jgi:hypothetical protein
MGAAGGINPTTGRYRMEAWTLADSRHHIEGRLPLVPLFKVDVIDASLAPGPPGRGGIPRIEPEEKRPLILAVRRDRAALTLASQNGKM